MEAAIADAAAALPDFPGFATRFWREMPCSHNGIDDPDYTNIEISYRFPAEIEDSEAVRDQYVDVLRDYWTSLGYAITTDSTDELDSGRIDHNLAADREDGIGLWYKVWGKVSIVAQSGCVPVSDEADIEYIPPAGGIEPGSAQDNVQEYFPDGIPTDQAAAIDPFATSQAAFGLVPFDSPDSYDGLILGVKDRRPYWRASREWRSGCRRKKAAGCHRGFNCHGRVLDSDRRRPFECLPRVRLRPWRRARMQARGRASQVLRQRRDHLFAVDTGPCVLRSQAGQPLLEVRDRLLLGRPADVRRPTHLGRRRYWCTRPGDRVSGAAVGR
ncbi:MAG TPA: hypothetical protein VGE61_07080 [Glycomyces sp.]